MEIFSQKLLKDKQKSCIVLSTNYKESGFKNTEYIICIFTNGTVIRYINDKRSKICKLPKKELDQFQYFLLSDLKIFDIDFKKDNDLIKINHFDIEFNVLEQKKIISDNKEIFYSIENSINKLIVTYLKNYDNKPLTFAFNLILDVLKERIMTQINK